METVTRDNKYYGEGPVFYKVWESMRDHKCIPLNIDKGPLEILRKKFVDKKAWINNSKETNKPPDFYSNKYKLMVEVMNVSDNERLNNKGKIIDPVKIQSEKMIKHLKNNGRLDHLSDNAFILPNPKLPELSREEFHNYDYYASSFNRIIGSHIKQIPTYRKNHPDKKLIFLIMDESAAYSNLPVDRDLVDIKVGDYLPDIVPHFWWQDHNLLKVFRGADLDYVLWFTPFKYIEMSDEYKEAKFPCPLPLLIVINPKEDICNIKQYDPKKMICSEG